MVPTLTDLSACWRRLAASLRPYAPAAALAYEQAADELNATLEAQQNAPLTLSEAARESGFSADHLGRLVREGRIPNAGRPHAPRIRRADLPRRPALPNAGDGTMLHSPGNLARAVASERNR
jgi:hypothetical protein